MYYTSMPDMFWKMLEWLCIFHIFVCEKIVLMPDQGEYTDEILVGLLKSGDQTAFCIVYDRLSPGLIRYIFKKTNDIESARDIVHDIFTKLWDKRRNLEITSSLAAYLYRQALNRCLNEFRHRKVADDYIHSLADFLEQVDVEADEKLLAEEFQSIVDRQINALPTKMREVIELRRQEGLSNKEIASAMNISEHTVSTHMKRALRILRSRLKFTTIVCFLLMQLF